MKNKISKLAIIVMVAILMTSTQPFNSRTAHAEDSNFSIVGDYTTPTNKDIALKLTASDELSGIKEIHLPDGKIIVESTGTYTITKNGKYDFKVVDKAGNETVGSLDIKNIFKALPKLILTADNTKLTNADVKITAVATAIGEGNSIVKVTGPPDAIKGTDGIYTVSKNGVYKFSAIDIAGNTVEQSIEVTNINKVLPKITIADYDTEWTNKSITVKATVDKGTLNASQHVFDENGEFTFTVTDEWGNKAQQVIKITNIDKVKPKIIINIQK